MGGGYWYRVRVIVFGMLFRELNIIGFQDVLCFWRKACVFFWIKFAAVYTLT